MTWVALMSPALPVQSLSPLFFRALFARAIVYIFYPLSVTVHSWNIPMLMQAPWGSLVSSFLYRLCPMGHRRQPIIGPRPGNAAERGLSLVPGPPPGKPSLELPDLCFWCPSRSLRLCRESLHPRPRPGTFAAAPWLLPHAISRVKA